MIQFLIIWACAYASIMLGVEIFRMVKTIIRNWHANDKSGKLEAEGFNG